MSNLNMDPTRSITSRKQLQVRLTAPIKKMKADVATILKGNPSPGDLRIWFDTYTSRTTPQVMEAIRKEVSAAYDRGAKSGATQVSSSSGKMRGYSPIMDRNKDTLNLLVRQAQDDYLTVLDETRNQVLRTYVNAVFQEKSLKDIVNLVKGRFDKIGITRSRAVANTGIVRANSEGMLDILTKMEIEQVTILAEWVTARKPCPLCQAKAGMILPIEKMRGLIPLHPNCLCTPKPVVKRATRTRKRRVAQQSFA